MKSGAPAFGGVDEDAGGVVGGVGGEEAVDGRRCGGFHRDPNPTAAPARGRRPARVRVGADDVADVHVRRIALGSGEVAVVDEGERQAATDVDDPGETGDALERAGLRPELPGDRRPEELSRRGCPSGRRRPSRRRALANPGRPMSLSAATSSLQVTWLAWSSPDPSLSEPSHDRDTELLELGGHRPRARRRCCPPSPP